MTNKQLAKIIKNHKGVMMINSGAYDVEVSKKSIYKIILNPYAQNDNAYFQHFIGESSGALFLSQADRY